MLAASLYAMLLQTKQAQVKIRLDKSIGLAVDCTKTAVAYS